jgi:hypothetical protein
MKVTITTELNSNSRIPPWLIEAANHADRCGGKLTITTGQVKKWISKKPVKP